MKLEAQLRRDVGVRRLLVRQGDVVADAQSADIGGTAIGGFHDAGAAAGDDHRAAGIAALAGLGDDLREAPRLVIVAGMPAQPLRTGESCLRLGVVRRAREPGLGLGNDALGLVRLDIAGAAEDDNGRFNPVLLQLRFRLPQLQLQSDRSQLLAQEKIAVGESELVARRACLLGLTNGRGTLGVLASARQHDVVGFVFTHRQQAQISDPGPTVDHSCA